MADEEFTTFAVKQGDCISSIAARAGLLWQTVWKHPRNAELRERRKDPNILFPGDQLAVPKKRIKHVSRPTEAEHTFVKLGTPAKMKLRLLHEGEPRASLPYVCSIDGKLQNGKTDADGYLMIFIPPNAVTGKLFVQNEKGEIEDEYLLQLGHLDPLTEINGVQKRLRNLGFECEVTGQLDEQTKAAVTMFRVAHKLESGEAIDENLIAKLKQTHGS